MKTLKSKLLASAAMLMLSVIMVTSASFAWFTISTNPEITGMTTQVVVNDNLEIALDKGYTSGPPASDYVANRTENDKAYTWGNILNLGNVTSYQGTEANPFSKELRPVELISTGNTAGTFQYPTYGADGRISNMVGMETIGLTNDAFGHLVDDKDATTPTVYGYYVDFWVRSNKTGTVALSAAANRVAGDNNTAGGGSTFSCGTGTVTEAEKELSKHIRIAFDDLSATNETNDVNKVATAMETKVPTAADGTATFEGDVVSLTANVAKKVRMYVYLDGTTATNAVASLSNGNATTLTDGTLNIQFALVDNNDTVIITTTDMDVNS